MFKQQDFARLDWTPEIEGFVTFLSFPLFSHFPNLFLRVLSKFDSCSCVTLLVASQQLQLLLILALKKQC